MKRKAYIKQEADGWYWSSDPEFKRNLWGNYATRGQATGAARRSLSHIVGGKTPPIDVIEVPSGTGRIS
jgi:hypothetical protein